MPWFTPASGKSGTLVNHHKTELLEEITKQFSLGTDNLMEDDKKYLLKCSITDLATTNGEQPEYGLLTSQIRAARARAASLLHQQAKQQQCIWI